MQIQYDTFEDWEDSFFVHDLRAGLPLTYTQKKFTILGIIAEEKDEEESILNLIRLGIDRHIYGMIIDIRSISKELSTKIERELISAGYIDVESYEFRMSFFKNWDCPTFDWGIIKNCFNNKKLAKSCYPLESSLSRTLRNIPIKNGKDINFDETIFNEMIKDWRSFVDRF